MSTLTKNYAILVSYRDNSYRWSTTRFEASVADDFITRVFDSLVQLPDIREVKIFEVAARPMFHTHATFEEDLTSDAMMEKLEILKGSLQ